MRHPVTITLHALKQPDQTIVMEYGQTIADLISTLPAPVDVINCHGKQMYTTMPLRGDMELWTK